MNKQLSEVTEPRLREMAAEQRFNLARLAAAFGVQPRTLHRYFVAHYRKSPRVWMNSARMAVAVGAIKQGEQLKSIAPLTGYSYQGNLSRSYKKMFGAAPSTKVTAKCPKMITSNSRMSENDK